jgi:alkanesulfonate monooxygenase
MVKPPSNRTIKVFSTCPQSSDIPREAYVQEVIRVSQWSEQYGCEGILVYTDNRLADPWLVSQIILQNTETLCPLIAVQPVYMHPYTAAKMVSSFAHFYGRRVYLNMLAGGFKNDLIALNDETPHDRRYDRMVEYTTIIMKLLEGAAPVTFNGEFYQVSILKLTPTIPQDLLPGILVSGSSEAGLAAASALRATAVHYPRPSSEYQSHTGNRSDSSGIRIGIIARETEESAWDIAYRRFSEDRKGQLTHQLAMKVSDSAWHTQLSELAAESKTKKSPYWLWPFENYKTFCPYLVGSYQRVATEIAKYIEIGHKTFILDIPPAEEDLYHTSVVFKCASEQVAK